MEGRVLVLLVVLAGGAQGKAMEGRQEDEGEDYAGDYNGDYNGDLTNDHYDEWNDWSAEDDPQHHDYQEGDYHWERVLEERGDAFWRKECRRWDGQEVYLSGDKVEHLGAFYRARWWNSAAEPGPAAEVWEAMGNSCNKLQVEPVLAEEDHHVEIVDEGEEEEDEDEGNAVDGDGPRPPHGPPTKAEADAKEAELTDTSLFTLVKASIATLASAEVDQVKPGRAANPANVRLLEKVLSAKDWEHIFPMREAAYSYTRFLQAAAKFPALCGAYSDGRDAEAICRRTLATMFAHFTQETGGHNPHAEVEQWRQGLVYLREAGCSEGGEGCKYDSSCSSTTWQGRTWPCGPGQKYYGRGAKQLSYNFNYGPFSDAMTGSVDTLLQNPDLVASTWFNLASATWFYTYPQPPKPSMLHVIDGTWQPNEEDQANKLEPGFGATIMIINGGIECGHGYEKPQATNRQKYYRKFAEYLKVDISGEELSCAHMKSFSKGGSGSLYIYWDREWTREYECQLVKYQTPFNALKPGDYTRCVEDQFKVKLH